MPFLRQYTAFLKLNVFQIVWKLEEGGINQNNTESFLNISNSVLLCTLQNMAPKLQSWTTVAIFFSVLYTPNGVLNKDNMINSLFTYLKLDIYIGDTIILHHG